MKEKYYYLRDEERRPLITVCLLYESGHIARGAAICSPSDNPEKKTGRLIAYRKAKRAINKKEDTCPVERGEPMSVLHKVTQSSVGLFDVYFDMFSYKSVYNPKLMGWEKQMLGVLN